MDFSPANCKNCYKCVRNCHVKAIKIIDDQAQIDDERCIKCGECFVVCPQNARNILSDLDLVQRSIDKGRTMIASIAPSYKGIYKEPKKIITALRKIGFTYVEETAFGAQVVTELYNSYTKNTNKTNLITSCCPSVNLLIEKYYPKLIDYLIPVDSPMIVHSKLIKEKYKEDIFITFIGPCISKKNEAYEENVRSLDAVLTFDELDFWLLSKGIEIDELDESELEIEANKIGKSYPIENGILEGLDSIVEEKYLPIKISGIDNCKELFESMEKNNITNVFVEANSCIGSCIGGPGITCHGSNQQEAYIRLKKSLKKGFISEDDCYNFNNNFYEKEFLNKEAILETPSEEKIKEILRKIGKHTKEDELNCGACGYDSCRDKAIAVSQGMSHIEMCIPNMRTRAERLIDTIFYNSPNIIMILDENLNILEFNPTAEKTFLVSAEKMFKKPISYLIDDEDFLFVKDTRKDIISKKIYCKKHNFTALTSILYLSKQNLYLTIMHDLTEEDKKSRKLLELKESTLEAAQDVINKQMRVAQEIASLLGETTAETKITLMQLQNVVRKEVGDIK